MARSMTGFGRGQADQGDRKCVVEIRTINNKYLDLQIRIPRRFYGIENKIREALSREIIRGKAEIYITYEDHSIDSKHVICDLPLAAEYDKALKQLAGVIGSEEKTSLSLISGFSDVLSVASEETNDETYWELTEPVIKQALSGLTMMRETEGKTLKDGITDYISELDSKLEDVCIRAPEIAPEFAGKLRKRIAELAGDLADQLIDEQRLTMEIAVFADKCSIDEETARLRSHISQFSDALNEKGSIGKKLDFIVQEMNREINTIGSKANDVITTGHVVGMKTIVEKIREQIQNIE